MKARSGTILLLAFVVALVRVVKGSVLEPTITDPWASCGSPAQSVSNMVKDTVTTPMVRETEVLYLNRRTGLIDDADSHNEEKTVSSIRR